MQAYFKKIRIASAIIIFVELASLLTFFFLYYYDVGSLKSSIDSYSLILITIGVVLLDWFIILIILLKINYIRYKNNLKTANLFGSTVQDSIEFAKLGIIAVNEEQNIIWCNEVINTVNEHLLDKNILDEFPKLREFMSKEDENKIIRITIKDLVFDVSYVPTSEVYFFKNVTDYDNLFKYSKEQAIVLGIIMIDNYDDLNSNEDESSDVMAKVKTKINDYFKNYGVLLRKYSNSSYFAICNYESLSKMKENEFEILDIVKEQAQEDELIPTLSIGFAHDFPSVYKLNEMANSAIEIAISRGGDQAVVSKYGSDLQFFGGKSEGVEKRNKVKVRVLADSLISILKNAKNVYIMGHTQMDMDALGSCLGVKAICNHLEIPSQIVYDPKLVERKAKTAFTSTFSKEESKELTILPRDAMNKITSKTLLVVVDFHRPSLALSKELLDACDKVLVIDHHRRSEEFIESPIFTYIETSASSACELIAELIKYSSINPPIEIPSNFATIMLSGVFLDTNYFRSTTSGFRTFEASMILKGFGADNILADDFLKDDYEEHLLISKIVSTIKTPFSGVVYCSCDNDTIIDSVTLSKVANECMQMKGVNAAFTIGRTSNDEVKISARSDGSINVQLICEKLGGGGHFAMAATLFKSKDVNEIIERLEETLEDYLDSARSTTNQESDN